MSNLLYSYEPISSQEEEVELFKRYAEGDESAKEEIILRSMRLVKFHAAKFCGKTQSMDIDDLVSDGTFGLIKAIEKFDYTKGIRFSTYATNWIVSSIDRGILEKDSIIHIPANVGYQARQTLGKKETIESDILEDLPEHIRSAIDLMNVISYDGTAFQGEDDAPLLDFLKSDEHIENGVLIKELGREVRNIMNDTLTDQEKYVVSCLFGIDKVPISQTEVAQELGMSRQNVVKILSRAFRKLRSGWALSRLKEYEKMSCEIEYECS